MFIPTETRFLCFLPFPSAVICTNLGASILWLVLKLHISGSHRCSGHAHRRTHTHMYAHARAQPLPPQARPAPRAGSVGLQSCSPAPSEAVSSSRPAKRDPPARCCQVLAAALPPEPGRERKRDPRPPANKRDPDFSRSAPRVRVLRLQGERRPSARTEGGRGPGRRTSRSSSPASSSPPP